MVASVFFPSLLFELLWDKLEPVWDSFVPMKGREMLRVVHLLNAPIPLHISRNKIFEGEEQKNFERRKIWRWKTDYIIMSWLRFFLQLYRVYYCLKVKTPPHTHSPLHHILHQSCFGFKLPCIVTSWLMARISFSSKSTSSFCKNKMEFEVMDSKSITCICQQQLALVLKFWGWLWRLNILVSIGHVYINQLMSFGDTPFKIVINCEILLLEFLLLYYGNADVYNMCKQVLPEWPF